MKRRDLLRKLQAMARAEGLTLRLTEGGRHTQAVIGERVSYIPRHREINEYTARGILEDLSAPDELGE